MYNHGLIHNAACSGAGDESTSSDPRIEKLKAIPEVWRFDIADGWNVRVKISADIDATCYMKFNTTTHQPSEYAYYYTIYYCVYQNDDFKFADYLIWNPKYYIEYSGTYTDASGKIVFVPDTIVNRYDIQVVSATKEITNNDSSFARFLLDLKFTAESIYYGFNEQGEWAPGEPVISEYTGGASKFLSGTNLSDRYILNGGIEDLHDYMLSFYYACTKLM